MLTIHAPAKVNWYLEIPGKRADGFHEIVTVMQAIDLCDTLRLDDAGSGIALQCNVDLGPPQSNLVYLAAALMQCEHAPARGVRIELEKRIPHGAGLGGGSSDAASTMVALNRLWGLNLPAPRLRELAARVGSDCAFFVEGGTALCTGRGEQVMQLSDQPGVHLVVLYPNAVCPTKDVYADLAQHRDYGAARNDLVHEFSGAVNEKRLGTLIHNRLQASALRVSSGLRIAWEQTAQEALGNVQFVSGSGSSIAFLTEGRQQAGKLTETLRSRGLGQAFSTTTLPRGARWG